MRLILVTFAFLAFAFYEMSGGADFDPYETRMARIELPEGMDAAEFEAITLAKAEPAAPENVTRVALSLTSVNDVLRPTTMNTRQAKRIQAVETTAPEAVSEEEPTIILPSLIVDSSVITPVTFGNRLQETPQAVPVASGDFDVRAVTGNSVNVRGGPGTEYGVVGRLVRGDKVEILQDPGSGWVKLRALGGGTEGWMASFLLGDG